MVDQIYIKLLIAAFIVEAKKDHAPESIIAAMIANLAHEAARIAWGKDDYASAAKVCEQVRLHLVGIDGTAPKDGGH